MISSNPTLGKGVFEKTRVRGAETMTVGGTINKSLILLTLVFATALWSWSKAWQSIANPELAVGMSIQGMAMVGGIVGFILAMITVFVKKAAPYTAPAYALAQGVFLGAFSAIMELQYGGIVFQAILGTFGTFFFMLFLYQNRVIRATDRFRKAMMIGMGGIFFIYLVSFIMSFFGTTIPYIHDSGPIGIGFSIVVVGLAAFSFILDFDGIERGEAAGAAKYMEWYGAFGLLVTLIWLYIEILRLLAKIRDRR